MNIDYIKKQVYGNEMLYIKNETIAATVRSLTGKKTIDQRDIDALIKLGATFTQVLN